MSHFVFGPSGKKGRNKFVGSYTETPSKNIDLPFTVEALKTVLQLGTTPDSSPYTHQDIAHWCDRFHMAMFDRDTDQKMNVATGIAADVDAQWDMYLANTYSLEGLQKLQHSTVCMPLEWFNDWLRQLESK